MNIREAVLTDIPEWARMRDLLWPGNQDDQEPEIEAYIEGTSTDIVQAFVIEDEAQNFAGFIELNIRNFAEGSRQPEVPYVEAWYIDEVHRGKGYGTKLMAKAETWALGRGYRELASDAVLDNHRSIAAHGKVGFKEVERVVCFLKQL